MKSVLLFRFLLLGFLMITGLLNPVFSQDTIYLSNPSFEDEPRKGGEFSKPIKGWKDCGLSKFPNESPVDIHPVRGYAWGVNMDPFDGATYLGLVVRYNDTYESVSQELSSPLKSGKCYSFSAVLAQNEIYNSATRRSQSQPENFSNPAIFIIWGAGQNCSKLELLGQTTPVDHSEWAYYDFIIKPTKDYTYITLEAYYTPSASQRYNGHILVDALSPIIEIGCE